MWRKYKLPTVGIHCWLALVICAGLFGCSGQPSRATDGGVRPIDKETQTAPSKGNTRTAIRSAAALFANLPKDLSPLSDDPIVHEPALKWIRNNIFGKTVEWNFEVGKIAFDTYGVPGGFYRPALSLPNPRKNALIQYQNVTGYQWGGSAALAGQKITTHIIDPFADAAPLLQTLAAHFAVRLQLHNPQPSVSRPRLMVNLDGAKRLRKSLEGRQFVIRGKITGVHFRDSNCFLELRFFKVVSTTKAISLVERLAGDWTADLDHNGKRTPVTMTMLANGSGILKYKYELVNTPYVQRYSVKLKSDGLLLTPHTSFDRSNSDFKRYLQRKVGFTWRDADTLILVDLNLLHHGNAPGSVVFRRVGARRKVDNRKTEPPDKNDQPNKAPIAGQKFRLIIGELDGARSESFKQSMKGGVLYQIDMTASKFSPAVNVRDAGGKQLASFSNWGRPVRLFFMPPATGTYTVEATAQFAGASKPGRHRGPFQITIQEIAKGEQGIVNGESPRFFPAPDSPCRYGSHKRRFLANKKYRIHAVSDDFTPLIFVCSGNRPLTAGAGGPLAFVTFEPETTGTYEIRVAGASLGAYTVFMTEEELKETEFRRHGVLTPLHPLHPVIKKRHQTFKVNLKNEREYTIDLGVNGSDLNLHLQDESGKTLARGSGNANKIVLRAPRTAVYRVIVTPGPTGKTGPFELSVRQTGAPAPVVYRKTGKLTREGPRDRIQWLSKFKVYSVNLKHGTEYIIELTGDFNTFLRLEDSAGKQLAYDDDSGEGYNAKLKFQPRQTATYRLIVTSYRGQTGSYELIIRQANTRPGGTAKSTPAPDPIQPKENGPKLASLSGAWAQVSFEDHQGNRWGANNRRFVFNGDSFRVYKGNALVFSASFQSDPKTGSFRFVQPRSGVTSAGIYRISGDTLTLCYSTAIRANPATQLQSGGPSAAHLVVLKRAR